MPPTPKAVRVRTASGWQDIAIVGPPGPTGPTGPQGAAAPIPPTEMNKVSRKIGGAGALDSASFTTAVELYSGGELRQAIVPTVNVWWEVDFWTLIRVVDANWMYMHFFIDLLAGATTTDALGRGEGPRHRYVVHNALSYMSIRTNALYKLNAGSSYTARGVVGPGNGTWVIHFDGLYNQSQSKVVGYW
jgi:hypothetical protein